MILSERKLLFACVTGAAVGIIILFVLSSILQPLQLTVSEAEALACSKASNNAKASITGFVDSVSIRSNHAVIKVAGYETIEAVSFDTELVKNLNLKRLSHVAVAGQLRNYEGRPSIIISKLRQINSSYGCGCGG